MRPKMIKHLQNSIKIVGLRGLLRDNTKKGEAVFPPQGAFN